MRRFVFCFVLLCGFFPALHGLFIKDIVVRGIVRIDRSFVLSHISVRKGQDVSEADLEKMLQELFLTGLFADVKGQIKNQTLYITVTENEVFNRIVFEGNKKIDSEALSKEIDLKPRQVYTPYRVQKAAQQVRDLYRMKGHVGAVVEPKIIRRPQGRVDLIFEIQDGRPQKIDAILFQGNKHFSASDLRGVVLTKESRWWRFLSSADTYEPDRLVYDRELLYRHYRDHGYADVDVVSVLTELSSNQQHFYITFHVQEGDLYHFGTIDLTSKVPDFDVKELRSLLEPQEKNVFNYSKIERTVFNINRFLSEKGLFYGVETDIRTDKEGKKIHVTFVIVPKKPMYVGNIWVRGNIATNDDVIRRESIVAPGDPLTNFKIERTRQKITNLDFFKAVDVQVEDVPETPDQKDVVIQVEDKSTGELMFSGGYSTADGPLFEVKAAERNFLGRGQELEFKGTVARRTKGVVLGFMEPYFLSRRLEAGVDCFAQQTRQDTLGSFQGGYSRNYLGAGSRLGFYLDTYLFERFRYSIRKETFKNNKTQSVFYQEMGRDVVSQLGHDLIYDRRNNMAEPTGGGYCGLTTNYAGLGGSVHFLGNDVMFGYYWALDNDRDLIVRLRGRYGIIVGCGGPLRVTDHLFMGGESVRGFEEVGIGPRDGTTGDAIGGRQSFLTNIELSYPLGKKSFGLTGFLFNDWGSLWSSGEASGPYGDRIVSNQFFIRNSVGFGIRFQSPFGLLGFSLGFPMKKMKGVDKRQVFRLNIGTEF